MNHYYPFGGVFASTGNAQPYKYNGKEFDTKKGLNWYDYGARHYDAALGRWLVVDPLAEKMSAWSPYSYCYNSPVKLVDEGGESPKVYKALYNVGKRAYKTYKKSGNFNLKKAFKDELVDIVENAKTLLDGEASTFDKVVAGVDLLTGFGEEISDGAKLMGIVDDAADIKKNAHNIFSGLGLEDGMKVNSSEILDMAEKFLGKGYKEIDGTGRFVSKDGTRVFRMGKNDIEGKHGGGSHVNFEILEPNSDKPGKMKVSKNLHIYINDEK